jgi:integrase
MTRPSASAVIAAFTPRSISLEAAVFARRVVASAEPESPERAKALLFAAGKLASYGSSIGLELEEKMLLKDSVIERFVCSPHAGSAPTRRTLRTSLRYLARACLEHPPPRPASLPRERAKAPYSAAELASYLGLADAQPTLLRRMRASALICLGAGAGLVGGELRHVRGIDVVSRSSGVVVLVAGARGRAVPVQSAYQRRLLYVAELFGEAYLVAGRDPNSHNVTNPLLRSLSGGVDLPRLEAGRLRASYLAAGAEQIGLRAFMDAAGITCSQRLGDLVAHLEVVPEERAVALLGGRR